MQPLKRKDSCTFKREKPLEVQERIYQLTNTLFIRGVSDSLWPWTKALTATQLCKNLYSGIPSMKNQSAPLAVDNVPLHRVK
jgi:hypothetical protein